MFGEETSGGLLDHWAWTLLIYLCISEICCWPFTSQPFVSPPKFCLGNQLHLIQTLPATENPPLHSWSVIYSSIHILCSPNAHARAWSVKNEYSSHRHSSFDSDLDSSLVRMRSRRCSFMIKAIKRIFCIVLYCIVLIIIFQLKWPTLSLNRGHGKISL